MVIYLVLDLFEILNGIQNLAFHPEKNFLVSTYKLYNDTS